MKKTISIGVRIGLVVGLAIIAVMAALGTDVSKSTFAESAALGDVSIIDLSFQPSLVVIAVGSSVKWTIGNGFHTTTSDPGSSDPWDSAGMSVGEMFTKTFNTPGTYAYHCTFHSNMIGTVFVADNTTYLPFIMR